MRGLLAGIVGAMLLTIGTILPTTPPTQVTPHAALAAAGVDLDGLLAATTWGQRVEAMTGIPPVHVEDDRDALTLILSIYDRLDLSITPEQHAQLAANLDALDPTLLRMLTTLLSPIDHGIRDWHHATAPLTTEDWHHLASLDLTADPLPETNAILRKIHTPILHHALGRLVAAIDNVQELAVDWNPPSTSKVTLFPGPNQGLLFNDPFNLILIGGPEDSTYVGNTGLIFLDNTEHLLILDPAGNDNYQSHVGTAHPMPRIVCGLYNCGGGLPMSIGIDLLGNDLYKPRDLRETVGIGRQAGIGIHLDATGNDAYQLDTMSAGAGLSQGFGVLLEGGGNDYYFLHGQGLGLGWHDISLGLLIELTGDDNYNMYSSGLGGTFYGSGLFGDIGGSDRFNTREFSAGSSRGGLAMFLNVGGADTHGVARNGLGWARDCLVKFPCVQNGMAAVFLDVCGRDQYTSPIGADGAMWQQHTIGYGIDQNAPALNCALYE